MNGRGGGSESEGSLGPFLAKLIARTGQGEIDWQLDQANQVMLEAESATISISCRDNDDMHPFRLLVVESDRNVAAVDIETSPQESYADEIRDLFMAARAYARGTGRVLGKLEDELGL